MMGLDVLRDLPGYKPILKAVLKEQIQLLVQQLSEHTGEETVVLSANVTDGTLSYLGTESGKVFLEEEQLIKSKFLKFCLKRNAWLPSESTDNGHSDSSFNPHMPAKRMRGLDEPDHWNPNLNTSSSQSLNIGPHTTGLADRQRTSMETFHLVCGPDMSGVQQDRLTNTKEQISNFSPPSHETGSLQTPNTSDNPSLSIVKMENFQDAWPGEEQRNDSYSSSQDNEAAVNVSQTSDTVDRNEQYLNCYSNQSDNMKGTSQKQSLDIDELSRIHDIPLSRYMRTFKCSFCDKTFREKTNLRVHERVHTGEKPFRCRICAKAFAHSSNVKQHERAVHKLAPAAPMYKQQFYNEMNAVFDSTSYMNNSGTDNSYLNSSESFSVNDSYSGQRVVKEEPVNDSDLYGLETSYPGESSDTSRTQEPAHIGS